jgi:hypothetical protein
MRNLARKIESTGTFQEEGRILSVENNLCEVHADSGHLHARRAVSCLLAPVPGDLVLLATNARGVSYVLAILEREPGAPSRLEVSGDLELAAPAGRLTLAAQEGVDLVSAQEVSITSGSLRLHAVDAEAVIERLSLIGSYVRADVETVKLLAESLDGVLDRLSIHARRAYRTVEGLDQVKAEQIDYAAEKTASLRGDNTLVTATELVKVDGAQIHVG